MARLRSYLLLTLVIGVLAAWAGAVDSSRVFDTWGLLSDFETDTNNTITADALGAPSSLNAVDDGPTNVDLSWTASNDSYATGYKVFRCSGAACSPTTLVHTLTEADTNCAADSSCDYEDTGRTGNTTYCYAVRTTYLNWTSPPSNTDCATTVIPVENRTLYLNSQGTNTNTLVNSAPSPGSRVIQGSANPPFPYVVWSSAPIKVTAAQTWTLTLELDTGGNFESTKLQFDLWLLTSGSCTATPSGISLGSSGPTVIQDTTPQPVQVTFSGGSFVPPQTGVLCLMITNATADAGNPHWAAIVTDGTSRIVGPWDPP